jgi:hypothetical protein
LWLHCLIPPLSFFLSYYLPALALAKVTNDFIATFIGSVSDYNAPSLLKSVLSFCSPLRSVCL